jgi:hypothetical protein
MRDSIMLQTIRFVEVNLCILRIIKEVNSVFYFMIATLSPNKKENLIMKTLLDSYKEMF